MDQDQYRSHHSRFCHRQVRGVAARNCDAARLAITDPKHRHVAADGRNDDGSGRSACGDRCVAYHLVNLAIERGEVRAKRGLIVIVTIAVALLAMMMIAYMLLTAEHI
jgi:hypothetical protein